MHGQMHVGRATYVLTAVVLRTLLHCNLGRKPSCSHPFHLLQQSGTTRRPWKRPPMLVLRWRCWLRNHDQDQHSSHLCLCGLLTFSSLLVCVHGNMHAIPLQPQNSQPCVESALRVSLGETCRGYSG
ncbi:hypothetical protein CCHR01_19343 [Colletotrichum chrysophilum]|uniref:Secreted protein n=1 Tax=Colletotrichum chrysophilum TaxID=1836956 RepID=A0AAD9E7A2_9PEZI|nr:hypothetical protein K456DRAFT_95980 [Colletotrichum gloeosporioides 23]KAK1838035.1 hypothetical protein CCHR01_19343 [Colletotrichum chrysophilum]